MRVRTAIVTLGVIFSIMIGGAMIVSADPAFEITTTDQARLTSQIELLK